jgi:hypothetical protein
MILRHISAERNPKVVQASASVVTGTWQGENGATIELSNNGKFSAENWPSVESNGASYKGSWKIQYLDASSPNAITLSFSPILEGAIGVPSRIDLVKTRSGDLGLCADDDPDNPCSYGVLTKK